MTLPVLCLLPLLFLLGACATLSPVHDKGGKTAETAADGSSSSVTYAQALKIAQAEIARREGWPQRQRSKDGRIHGVLYSLKRINRGGYRVEANRSTTHPNHPCEVLDPAPPAVMIIDQQGQVTHYTLKEKSD